MKRWVPGFSKGLNPMVLPAMTIAAPTMPPVFQLGSGVVVLIAAHGAVEEWRQPDALRGDRVVADLTVTGLVLLGVLLMLMLASAIHQFSQRPSAPFISQA